MRDGDIIMDEKIIYLLKFGKKEHIEEFVSGCLYCSTAETFWKIEKDTKIKGHGDELESGFKVHASKMELEDVETHKKIEINQDSVGLIHIDSAKKIPVFCMFAVYDDDCINSSNGNKKIHLIERKQRIIKEHFPNADTVAIIKNPKKFINNIKRDINLDIKEGLVHYFNIDNNGPMDMEYIQYLMQDTKPKIEGKKKKYTFYEKNVFRILFCKDKYFKDEQEYRVIFPKEKIENSTKYLFSNLKDIEVKSIDDFFRDM